MVHAAIRIDEDHALEDLHHLQGHVERDWDEIAVKHEAGDERIHTHDDGMVGVIGPLCVIWTKVPHTSAASLGPDGQNDRSYDT